MLTFYFSNVFDRLGRSLSLIGAGLVFLLMGWGLTRARQYLLERIQAGEPAR